MLNGLDLFSGYGGITLALSKWVRPIAYCEIDRYAQGILLSRISDNKLPNAPIWDDVRTLDGRVFRGAVDIVYGGFPCQDISSAGFKKGLDGKRSALFFEIMRLADEIKPTFIFLENVQGIRKRGLNQVGFELAHRGYDCRWTIISASEVGALHLRRRWFLLAYSDRNDGKKKFMADTDATRLQIRKKRKFGETNSISAEFPCSWETEPDVGRVVDGCAFRVDRLKALGNGVVPLQAETAFKRLIGFEN